MTASASVQGNKSKHTRGYNERYLIRTNSYVAVSKAKFADKLHFVLSSPD